MKIPIHVSNVEVHNLFNAQPFGIKPSAHAFELVSGMLGDPSLASIYIECIANARDAGANDIRVHVDGEHLEIYDNGQGMSKDDVEQQLAKVFESQKMHNNDTYGAYGIGVISMFSKYHTVYLQTVKDGIRTLWKLSVNKGELPAIDLLQEEATQEPPETTWIFPHDNIKQPLVEIANAAMRATQQFIRHVTYTQTNRVYANVDSKNVRAVKPNHLSKHYYGIATQNVYDDGNVLNILVGERWYTVTTQSEEDRKARDLYLSEYGKTFVIDRSDNTIRLEHVSLYPKFAIGEIPINIDKTTISWSESLQTLLHRKAEESLPLFVQEYETVINTITTDPDVKYTLQSRSARYHQMMPTALITPQIRAQISTLTNITREQEFMRQNFAEAVHQHPDIFRTKGLVQIDRLHDKSCTLDTMLSQKNVILPWHVIKEQMQSRVMTPNIVVGLEKYGDQWMVDLSKSQYYKSEHRKIIKHIVIPIIFDEKKGILHVDGKPKDILAKYDPHTCSMVLTDVYKILLNADSSREIMFTSKKWIANNDNLQNVLDPIIAKNLCTKIQGTHIYHTVDDTAIDKSVSALYPIANNDMQRTLIIAHAWNQNPSATSLAIQVQSQGIIDIPLLHSDRKIHTSEESWNILSKVLNDRPEIEKELLELLNQIQALPKISKKRVGYNSETLYRTFNDYSWRTLPREIQEKITNLMMHPEIQSVYAAMNYTASVSIKPVKIIPPTAPQSTNFEL